MSISSTEAHAFVSPIKSFLSLLQLFSPSSLTLLLYFTTLLSTCSLISPVSTGSTNGIHSTVLQVTECFLSSVALLEILACFVTGNDIPIYSLTIEKCVFLH